MPKIDEAIKRAILEAAKAKGSQAKVAQEAGITPTALNRYLSGKILSINASTWNMLAPIILDYLPEEYSLGFSMDSTTKGKRWAQQYDIKKSASEERLQEEKEAREATINVIESKLEFLSQQELDDLLSEILFFLKQRNENKK